MLLTFRCPNLSSISCYFQNEKRSRPYIKRTFMLSERKVWIRVNVVSDPIYRILSTRDRIQGTGRSNGTPFPNPFITTIQWRKSNKFYQSVLINDDNIKESTRIHLKFKYDYYIVFQRKYTYKSGIIHGNWRARVNHYSVVTWKCFIRFFEDVWWDTLIILGVYVSCLYTVEK